jgi:hypothetical protein
MEVAHTVAAVELRVHALKAHLRPAFAVEAGVRWRWTDQTARQRDAAIRDALRGLATRG